mmetsp:Transcript_40801/g.135062  ORF Transcript_40801/g.135062 Transcript_40801/m.135062 type:complete len:202 (+) Transcript_40801:1051-1656(+)
MTWWRRRARCAASWSSTLCPCRRCCGAPMLSAGGGWAATSAARWRAPSTSRCCAVAGTWRRCTRASPSLSRGSARTLSATRPSRRASRRAPPAGRRRRSTGTSARCGTTCPPRSAAPSSRCCRCLTRCGPRCGGRRGEPRRCCATLSTSRRRRLCTARSARRRARRSSTTSRSRRRCLACAASPPTSRRERRARRAWTRPC